MEFRGKYHNKDSLLFICLNPFEFLLHFGGLKEAIFAVTVTHSRNYSFIYSRRYIIQGIGPVTVKA